MNVNIKYLKDEDGNYISPVVSADGVFDSTGVSISTTLGNIGTLLDTINGETSYSTINIINFTINGTSYQAEEGMTWYEWCNSDYNTSIWVCPTSTQTVITYSGGTGQEYLALKSGHKTTACAASDIIIANHAYGTGTSSK